MASAEQTMTPRILLGIPALLVAFTGLASGAEEMKDEAALIADVKAHPDFKVHTVTLRVPASGSNSWLEWLDSLNLPPGLAQVIGYLFLALLTGLVIWLVWRNRMAFRMGGTGGERHGHTGPARVVMGMAVHPESLPEQLPDVVWRLWQAGQRREALGLLYRGAISRVIHRGKVDISESDTEGDCLRRVELAENDGLSQDYFAKVTRAWTGGAYAGRFPTDEEARSMCDGWPYDERRDA